MDCENCSNASICKYVSEVSIFKEQVEKIRRNIPNDNLNRPLFIINIKCNMLREKAKVIKRTCVKQETNIFQKIVNNKNDCFDDVPRYIKFQKMNED